MGANILDALPSRFLEMPGYEPIEPIDVLASELGIPEEQVIKLDGNENPFGPSPKVARALERFPYYHIYTDPEQRTLRRAIAQYIKVDAATVVCGAGADDLLDIIGRMFIREGANVVSCPPTFGMYTFIASLYGGRFVAVERKPDFSLNLSQMGEVLRDGKSIVFLASPNNPTGNPLSRDEVERLLATDATVVIDEAYIEFGGESFVEMISSHDNLIIIRTFSKWAGLAGLRIGYAVMAPALAEVALKTKMPYNLNAAAQVAVLASLADTPTLMGRVRLLVAERERLFAALSATSWLKPWPSQGNFLLCAVHGPPAKEVWGRLRKQGILVRYFDTPQLRLCLRFTVGKPEQSERLLAALEEIGANFAG